MTRFVIFLSLLMLPLFSQKISAQTMAITEHGDTIYVYDNGVWTFERMEEMPELNELAFLETPIVFDTIPTAFKAPKTAKKAVENKNKQYKIKYDEASWKRVPPATLNDDAEFAFESKESDIWVIAIYEESVVPADKLFRIAKKNMEDFSGSKVDIATSEVRTVNGKKVIHGIIKANLSGINFTFDSYYYSDEKGSLQYTTWTTDGLWSKHQDKIEALLNGLVVE